MKRVRLSSSVSSEEEFVNMVTRDVPSLTDSLLLESTKVFAGFLVNRESDSFCEESSGNVSQSAVLATAIFRRVAAGNTKLKQREDLQKAARDILGDERSVASVFCLSLLLAALTLTVTEENRAISRSAASAKRSAWSAMTARSTSEPGFSCPRANEPNKMASATSARIDNTARKLARTVLSTATLRHYHA